ncbi:MAG TPA: site-specific integrase [Nitrososphaeraceae archaeon]
MPTPITSTTAASMTQSQLQSQEHSEAYLNFISSVDSEFSRRTYQQVFPFFMKFCQVETYDAMLEIQSVKKLEGLIRDYIIYLKEDRKASPGTIRSYTTAIAHFYEMNDVRINWKKLKKFKGKYHSVVEDVPYTRNQIKSLIEMSDLRERAMILMMASAGLRRGALITMKLKDLQKIAKYNLYKITVYKKEAEQYLTYCTPECAQALDQYLDWRARLGEELTPSTIMFRKAFDITSPMIITRPKPLRPESITSFMIELLDKTGIRTPTDSKFARSNLMTCHGFRKFFHTECINHNMNPLYAEYLMGHKTGLMKSYFKPTDNELLEGNDKSVGYIGLIPYLTIHATEEENERLRRQVETLQVEKSQIEDLQKEMNAIRELVLFKTKGPNT